MKRRIGVIGIVIEKRKEAAPEVNEILSEHAQLIVGRMGIPYRREDVAVIALIVDGTPDAIGALTGRLGNIEGVVLRSALTARESGGE